jgi:glycine hydroxymethyltransferase
MIVLDLSNLGLNGKDAEAVLETAGITVNKNSVPFEKLSPHVTSGIRIGTPAVTTRGMKEPEMEMIAKLIIDILKDPDNERLIKEVKAEVSELCMAFPLYKGNDF